MSRFHERFGAGLQVTIALAFGLLYASTSRADPAPETDADALFAQGKAALAAQDYGKACPLLAESYRVDPATGSLLALAYCHESEGKLASALSAYRQVMVRSQAEGRRDRERAAQERETALAQQVSTLTLRSDANQQGLEITLDGVALDLSSLDRPIPIDGGTHTVSATAPNRSPWSLELILAAAGDHQVVTLPSLVAQAAPPHPSLRLGRMVPLVRPLAPRTRERSDRPLSHLVTWTVAGSLTAGISTLCAGGLLALRAVHDNNVANSGCTRDGCVEDPVQKPLRLGSAANLTLAAGGLLTATGVVVLILAKHDGTSAKERTRSALIAPWAAPHGAGAALHGRF